MNIAKRGIISLLFLWIVCVGAWADALTDFLNNPAINSNETSVMIINVRTGKEIVQHNVLTPLVPASIMKAVTIATLLEKVGPNYRYRTPVYITGDIRSSELQGNIIIEASADPSINSRHACGSEDFIKEITDALKRLGVTDVNGRIIIDQSKWPGPCTNPTWSAGDLKHSYGTGTHGFNFEDNSKGDKAVGNPADVFTSSLTAALSKAGINVKNGEISNNRKRHLLGEHQSATIDEIMRSCMMRSDNQFAESMLRLIGSKYGGVGSTAKGAEEMTRYWTNRRAPMDGVKIVDGSGLSRSNRVTAKFMTEILKRMWKNPYYASFFPLAGQEGTLKSFLKGTPLEEDIALKTGSMNGIQCYAGYKLDRNYKPTHIVVIIMNSMGDRAAARLATEQLLLSIFA